jgi:hypothetical protein
MAFNIVLANEDNDGNRTRKASNDDGPTNQAEPEQVNGLLTQKEIAELADLLKRLPKDDVDAFLDWFQLADIGAIGRIDAKEFPKAKNQLLNRLKVLTEREAFAARTRAAAARQPRDERVVGKMMDAWDAIKRGDRP